MSQVDEIQVCAVNSKTLVKTTQEEQMSGVGIYNMKAGKKVCTALLFESQEAVDALIAVLVEVRIKRKGGQNAKG